MNLFLKLKILLKSIYKEYKIHFVVWTLFIFYEFLIAIIVKRPLASPIIYFLYYSLNICLFYANTYFFTRVIGQKILSLRFLYILLLIVTEIVCYVTANFYGEKLLGHYQLIPSRNLELSDMNFLGTTAWRALYFIGFSVGFVYIMKSMKEAKRTEELRRANLENTIYNQRLENELVKVENDYLRSQINPHFLFNTLSFIYNGTRKTAPDAASAILSLSDMMRYALKQPGSSDTIYLKDEIEQVQNLINLHKLRTKNGVFIDLAISGDLTQVKFLPLMLLTLVENVFKHGNLGNEQVPAVVTVAVKDDELYISTENLIAERAHGESNSVGMENIRKRLNGYYKDRATLVFEKRDQNMFYTAITVKDF